MNHLHQLDKRLRDRKWRLNNLYWIEGEDEQGRRMVMRFRMNWAQQHFYGTLWWLCCILKVRQMGFSTFIAIFGLDELQSAGGDSRRRDPACADPQPSLPWR